MDKERTALRRLLRVTAEKPKGDIARRREVAGRVGGSADYLYQIATGIKLKSGKTRTVGRELRVALDREYPGWLDQIPSPAPATDKPLLSVAPAPVTLTMALEVLGIALAADMQPDQRAELAEAMSAWVRYAGKERYRATVSELLAAPASPTQKRLAAG